MTLVRTASPPAIPATHGRPRSAARNDAADSIRKSPSEYTAVNTNAVGKSASTSTVSRAPAAPSFGRAISNTSQAPRPAATSERIVPQTIEEPSRESSAGYRGKNAAEVSS